MQEQAMAQETAASMTAPEGAIWQAWLDALIHPKYETYARWFPLMKSRWRNISLAVSLMLIILNIYAHGALDVFTVSHKSQALAFGNMVAYFSSPRGLYFIFFMDRARYYCFT
jgi:hypothetical protein